MGLGGCVLERPLPLHDHMNFGNSFILAGFASLRVSARGLRTLELPLPLLVGEQAGAFLRMASMQP